MSNDQKYGWTCGSLDDERMECPFDSIADALSDAKTTIEEEAPDREWDAGSRTVEVYVSRVAPLRAFDPERILDDIEERVGQEGFEEPDEHLRLVATSARAALHNALQAAWDAHVEREKVHALWTATHSPTRHSVEVTIKEPE